MTNDNGLNPASLAQHAANFLKVLQETNDLSLMEMAAVLRSAAAICDENHSLYERAQMQIKLRNWQPGK